MYFVQFLDNIKCHFVFWALFVKILLYLWYIFYFISVTFSMCTLLVDMHMSI